MDVLGYVLHPQPNFNLITEQKNEKDSKKADGAILLYPDPNSPETKVVAVIELKSVKTTDLQAIEIQAFNYKNNQSECLYVITSNFQKIRFYIENAIAYEEFDLFDLSRERFALLYLCLHTDSIRTGLPLKVKKLSLEKEESITNKLYADYSLFKQALFKDVVAQNKHLDRLLLFKKTQKLLDRFLFIFFAEDKGLLPPNSVDEILKQWEKLNELDEYKPLYDRFKKYFGYLNSGHKGKHYEIFAYNGGLFAPDELLDNLKITDQLLYVHSKVLAHYDFDTDVDTNILGHIFEHSLNELDEIAAGIERAKLDKTKTRRKKDGVFYTPRYITKYIVESTLGELCRQQKQQLGLDSDTLVRIDTKAQKKDYHARIKQYREWLLQLTILDPACGSGAFLNQALEFLIEEHYQVDSMTAMLFGDSMTFTDNVTEILENNIFGVDINEESVEIARLALWLRTAKVGRKLNDLSRNIKCGNSLISDPNVAGELAFDWQKSFPKVFSRKEKEGFHVVLTTHNSRTSQRMIKYKVQKGAPLEFTLEDEIDMAAIMRDIVLENGYHCIACNICKDHVHLVLVCEYAELPGIVKTIKGKSAYLFNRRKSNIDNGLKPIGREKPIGGEKTVGGEGTNPSNGFQPIDDNGLKPVGGEETVGGWDTVGGAVWSAKFFRAFLDSWELADASYKPGWMYNDSYLANAIRYVKNNRVKHNLPQSDTLDAIIASFCKTAEQAYADEWKGGFDVVIGNPPYVDIKAIDSKTVECLFKTYKTAENRINLYSLFIEKGYELLRENGFLYFINPNSILVNSSYTKIRKLLLQDVSCVIKLPDDVFPDAKVETIILGITKNNTAPTISTLVYPRSETISSIEAEGIVKTLRSTWNENSYNIHATNAEFEVLAKIEKQCLKLEEIVDFSLGITPYDKYKGHSEDLIKNRKFHSENQEDDSFKPLIGGENVQRYFIDDTPSEYLKYGDWLGAMRQERFFTEPRIIIRQIISGTPPRIYAGYTEAKLYYTQIGFGLITKSNSSFETKYILCLLNSKLITFYHKYKYLDIEKDLFQKILIANCKNLPIKKIETEKQLKFCKLADEVILNNVEIRKCISRFLKLLQSSFPTLASNKKLEQWYELSFGDFRKELAKQKISIPIKELLEYQDLFEEQQRQAKSLKSQIQQTERTIDQLVYALYGLTSEEIALIEGS